MNEQRMVPPEEIERQKAVAARLKAAGGGRVWIKTFGCQQKSRTARSCSASASCAAIPRPTIRRRPT
ncbi:MAG: hypothetical protein ACLUFV_05920 [Acutalibacteraceae bacterium]